MAAILHLKYTAQDRVLGMPVSCSESPGGAAEQCYSRLSALLRNYLLVLPCLVITNAPLPSSRRSDLKETRTVSGC